MSVTEQSVKEQIVMFCSADGKLRIVICTVAFEMGLGLSQCTENHPLGAVGMMEASDKQHTTKVMVITVDTSNFSQCIFTSSVVTCKKQPSIPKNIETLLLHSLDCM